MRSSSQKPPTGSRQIEPRSSSSTQVPPPSDWHDTVTVWPNGESPPATSNLNAVPGQTVANLVICRLGWAGALLLEDGTMLRVYYGAADSVTAAADLHLDEILASLT